jgi:hypothetical protein
MRKGQADIITAVIILILAISLFSLGYRYIKPMLEKRQDEAMVERVRNAFDQSNPSSLSSKIESVSKLGGEDTFTLDINGFWELNESEDSISFKFNSKVTDIAAGLGWISLTEGESCPPSSGTVGSDKISVVCAKAEKVGETYEITYKIFFRELEDPITNRIYKIDLVKHEAGVLTSGRKTVKIVRGSESVTTRDSKTLISTEIKILLV